MRSWSTEFSDFFNALLSFVIVAAVLFFRVVKPVNVLMARSKTEEPVAEETCEWPGCVSSIPAAARRCAFCTAEVGPASTI